MKPCLSYPDNMSLDMTVKELFTSKQIEIEIIEIHRNHVIIGIIAPEQCTIMRK